MCTRACRPSRASGPAHALHDEQVVRFHREQPVIAILGRHAPPDEAVALRALAAGPLAAPEATFRRLGRCLLGMASHPDFVDSSISAVGRGGVGLGLGPSATTVTDITGLHLDNFQVTPSVADGCFTS